MINFQAIDHICILVSNLEISKKYYEELFNVACKSHPGIRLECIEPLNY